ncbi:tRNA pseudouridine(65) synthase TruC, partial [Proteus mirabilis]
NRWVVNHFQSNRLMLHASQRNLIHPITQHPLILTAKWYLPWQHLINQFVWSGIKTELEQFFEDLALHFVLYDI